jgi:hypothetical protein
VSIAGLIQSASAPAVDGHSSLVRVVHAGTLYNMRDTIVGDTDVVAVCLAAIDDVCVVGSAMPRAARGSRAPIGRNRCGSVDWTDLAGERSVWLVIIR